MPMNRLRYIALLLALSFCLLSFAGDGKKSCLPVKDLNESNLAFGNGEDLTFKLNYKWGMINADVANAYMKVVSTTMNGKEVYHATISGHTLKLYDNLFKVRETLDSWFTCDGFSPVRFKRISKEGNYWLNNNSSFVWYESKGVVTANMETSRKGQFSLQKELTSCTLDIPTMFYLLRNVDLTNIQTGKRYPLSFIMDDDVYTLHCVYLGKETKSISGLGKVRCLKFGFEVVAGDVFSGDSDLYCWISDDDNRIPVYFRAPLKIGQFKGRLESYKGLKHPFSSLVQ